MDCHCCHFLLFFPSLLQATVNKIILSFWFSLWYSSMQIADVNHMVFQSSGNKTHPKSVCTLKEILVCFFCLYELPQNTFILTGFFLKMERKRPMTFFPFINQTLRQLKIWFLPHTRCLDCSIGKLLETWIIVFFFNKIQFPFICKNLMDC